MWATRVWTPSPTTCPRGFAPSTSHGAPTSQVSHLPLLPISGPSKKLKWLCLASIRLLLFVLLFFLLFTQGNCVYSLCALANDLKYLNLSGGFRFDQNFFSLVSFLSRPDYYWGCFVADCYFLLLLKLFGEITNLEVLCLNDCMSLTPDMFEPPLVFTGLRSLEISRNWQLKGSIRAIAKSLPKLVHFQGKLSLNPMLHMRCSQSAFLFGFIVLRCYFVVCSNRAGWCRRKTWRSPQARVHGRVALSRGVCWPRLLPEGGDCEVICMGWRPRKWRRWTGQRWPTSQRSWFASSSWEPPVWIDELGKIRCSNEEIFVKRRKIFLLFLLPSSSWMSDPVESNCLTNHGVMETRRKRTQKKEQQTDLQDWYFGEEKKKNEERKKEKKEWKTKRKKHKSSTQHVRSYEKTKGYAVRGAGTEQWARWRKKNLPFIVPLFPLPLPLSRLLPFLVHSVSLPL